MLYLKIINATDPFINDNDADKTNQIYTIGLHQIKIIHNLVYLLY